jgi:hypothetical protein
VHELQQELSQAVSDGSLLLRARMIGSRDEYAQGVALALQARADYARLLPECMNGSGCDEARARNQAEVSNGPVEHRAATARASKSETLYGLALRSCGLSRINGGPPPSCLTLSNQR